MVRMIAFEILIFVCMGLFVVFILRRYFREEREMAADLKKMRSLDRELDLHLNKPRSWIILCEEDSFDYVRRKINTVAVKR